MEIRMMKKINYIFPEPKKVWVLIKKLSLNGTPVSRQ